MNTKEAIKNIVNSDFCDGPISKNTSSLLDLVVTKISLKDILTLKNNLIDNNFKSLMKDKDMVNCIEEFFRFNLNVAETSRNSYLHRNTLEYRIKRIHQLTGLNLKNFDDAVSFKILMQVYKLTT